MPLCCDNYNNSVYTTSPYIFESDNALGEEVGANFVVDDDKTMTYSQQQEVEVECKSPCPSSAEMCIEICA